MNRSSFFRRRGESIETEQKFGAATNKHTGTTLNTTKLDRETEELKHERVPLELGKAIMKGRNDKVNMTQQICASCRGSNLHKLLDFYVATIKLLIAFQMSTKL